MKRWGTALLIAVLSCIPTLLRHATSPALLQDSDTAFLLKIIRERQSPLSWFTEDWPLQNHFYRPVSTLAFELDNHLYGNNAAGYGWTNAILCALCVLLVAWLWREVTDSLPLTCAATALFGLWHWNGAGWLQTLSWYAGLSLALGNLVWRAWRRWVPSVAATRTPEARARSLREDFAFAKWLPASAALCFFGGDLGGMMPLEFRMIGWIPGRTASVMTVFCLIAMAAYARYERSSAKRDEAPPTALDEPATKSSVQASESSKAAWIWAVVAILAGALALASYEQAVMLPTALFGIAVSMRLRRYRVRWGWQIAFWGLLVGYFVIRHAYVPSNTSNYQAQQFRDGPGVYISLLEYLFPAANSLQILWRSLDLGWIIFLTDRIYMTTWHVLGNVSALGAALRHWQLALTGYALAFFAYLPMAWLNQFDHYHYWPMALRSLYVAVLAWGLWELCVIAISPRGRSAPPRLVPSPGSLPRR